MEVGQSDQRASRRGERSLRIGTKWLREEDEDRGFTGGHWTEGRKRRCVGAEQGKGIKRGGGDGAAASGSFGCGPCGGRRVAAVARTPPFAMVTRRPGGRNVLRPPKTKREKRCVRGNRFMLYVVRVCTVSLLTWSLIGWKIIVL